MKVVVTSRGTDWTSQIDLRFARAPYFLVVDTESDQLTVVDNRQIAETSQGAGVQAGRAVVELGAKALISGNVGPRAMETLSAGGVAVYSGVSGTVKDVLEVFRAGGLSPSEEVVVRRKW